MASRLSVLKTFSNSKGYRYKTRRLRNISRHAYLVIAHHDWRLLSKLLRCLDDSRNAIFIHVDKKADFTQSVLYEPQKAVYSYIRRRTVSWGGYSQIAAEIALLEASTIQRFDYYHLLSGQDLPIKSQDYIHDFFDNQGRENSYISFDNPDGVYNIALDRLGQYHFLQDSIGRNSGKKIRIYNKLENKSLSIQRKLKVNRIVNYPFKIYKGANWFSINHELAQYVISRKKDIKKYFNNSFCADELFLQTIVQDSPFRDKIIHSDLREIDWKRGIPYTYRKEDFSLLMKSGSLFARKFSTDVDEEIIDMICAQISGES